VADQRALTSTEPPAAETAELSPRPSLVAVEEEVVAQPILESATLQPELSDEQGSVVGAHVEREQVSDPANEASRGIAEEVPISTEIAAPAASLVPEIDTTASIGYLAAKVLEEPSATSQTFVTANGDTTVDDDLAELEGQVAVSPMASELAVTTTAQAVTASQTEEHAATVGSADTLPADLPDETGGRLAEAEGDAMERLGVVGESAAPDTEPIASGSSETTERPEAPAAVPARGDPTLAAATDAVEPSAGPVPADISLPVDLSLVHFDVSSSYLSPGAVMMVDRAAASLHGLNGTFSVEIKGFTDTVGSDEFNLWLAERRVNRVIDALVDRGVPRESLIASPRGPFGLPVPTDDNVSEPLNRCVAITLVEMP
jgi:outer membrane protein OmpA-like peptidoglycan-associated protein